MCVYITIICVLIKFAYLLSKNKLNRYNFYFKIFRFFLFDGIKKYQKLIKSLNLQKT